MSALTFDMRGGRKQAKLACGRPLDGRVRALFMQVLDDPWDAMRPALVGPTDCAPTRCGLCLTFE
jgi:hypothetical protein